MENTLTIKELAAYLPYGVNVQVTREDGSPDTVVLNAAKLLLILDGYYAGTEQLFLHPITEDFLTDTLAHPDDIDEVLEARDADTLEYIRHDLYVKIVKNHGDIFNLIPRGLALPIEEKEVQGVK